RTHAGDDGTLLRGNPLAVAEDWLDRRGEEIADEEHAYIEASIARRGEEERQNKEALARERKRLSETAAAQTRTARLQRRARWALAGVAGVVAIGLGFGLWQ